LLAATISVPRIHGLRALYSRYPAKSSPALDEDDLDLLDPWVIDGRYAADLPDVAAVEATKLIDAAQRIVDGVRQRIT
jgi:HEPN domain-containing protein